MVPCQTENSLRSSTKIINWKKIELETKMKINET